MPKPDFRYVDQDYTEPTFVPCQRPSATVRDRRPSGITNGLERPYFIEKAQEVAGRCACCGTHLQPDQDHCPDCHSVNSRISELDQG